MSDDLETTLTNTQDDKVNLAKGEDMLESLADEFFDNEDTLPSEENDGTEDNAASDDEAEESDELEEEFEDDESEEEDGENLPEDEEDDSEELDMDFEVPVKVDGQESVVSMAELIKGYQTAAHSNKKSIEASEQLRKAATLQEEATKLKEQNAVLLGNQVSTDEQQLAAYDRKIQQLISDDDMFELPKWQEARRIKSQELSAKKAEAKRLQDEATVEFNASQEAAIANAREEAITTLNKTLPNWQESYQEVVTWAAEELGAPLFAEITDPLVIELMYDYKALKDGKKTAVKKRKKAPVKNVKAKKLTSKKKKISEADRKIRKKVLSGKASEGQQDAFMDALVDDLLD